MLLTPLMNGQAFLRPHTHTRHKPDSQSNPGRPSEQALAGARHGGGQWAHPWRRAHGGHTLSLKHLLSLCLDRPAYVSHLKAQQKELPPAF